VNEPDKMIVDGQAIDRWLYNVVRDWDATRFEQTVETQLNSGWELVGGVSVAVTKDSEALDEYFFCQAMKRAQVRPKEDKSQIPLL